MVTTLDFSPGKRFLASGQSSNKKISPKIVIWDYKEKKKLHTLKGHKRRIDSITWFPDGNRLVSGGKDQTIIIWDVNRGKKIKSFEGYT